ncbi:serine/threonine-protein kinase Nek11 isoform X2 [Dipodomys merriami]|uniref:serine/threonine-protein kinase Nek11 isoform X2 n=1 Tax=Dipodomys merriami TaxID=94247 RepID=UPI003855E849
MLKFQETAKCGNGSADVPVHPQALIARRYVLQQKLGSGSFGTVYLVSDKKAKRGEELKVLKEISVGELNPNETIQASLEAQLLSKLDHPAIVKFHASFVEKANFCIITEYCEGRDLDYKIQEYKETGKVFPENQVVEWFIQLLLGVDYMHERRILHRDLKSKNIFLKNNLLKIGDFGVSRLLMGSCDMATTLTGTPHYMSPETLTHQGYDTKSDIWSLACILYEICCLSHAFTGSNFLSIILKIVEGDTPSLPERYPRELNSIMESMLNKSPSLRPSAIEILKVPYIDEQLQHLLCRYSEMTQEDMHLDCQEADRIVNALQKKIHLQTPQELSDVQKMTLRERMRPRKLQAAHEKARKLKKIVEEKYEENNKQMQELRPWNSEQLSIDVIGEGKPFMGKEEKEERPEGRLSCSSQEKGEERQPAWEEALGGPPAETLPESQPAPSLDPGDLEGSAEDTTANLHHHEIPEDTLTAEEYYADGFDSCSEESEEQEEEIVFPGPELEINDESPPSGYRTNHQDSDVEALVRCLEKALDCTSLDTRTTTSTEAEDLSPGPRELNRAMARARMQHIRAEAILWWF